MKNIIYYHAWGQGTFKKELHMQTPQSNEQETHEDKHYEESNGYGTVFSKKTPNDDGHISTVNEHLSSLWCERGRVGFPHTAGAKKHLKPTLLPVPVGGSCICIECQQSLLHYSSNWREQHGVYWAINIQLAHYLPVKRQTDDSAVLQQSFSGREATSTRSLTPKCSRIPVQAELVCLHALGFQAEKWALKENIYIYIYRIMLFLPLSFSLFSSLIFCWF